MPTEFSGTREEKYAATATCVSYLPGRARRTVVGRLNKNTRIAFAERFGRIRREKDIASEIPVLESRYRRLVQLFEEQGVADIEPWVKQELSNPRGNWDILEQAIESMQDLKQRANFEVYLKKFLQSMDMILPKPAANPFSIPAKRFGYLLVKVKDRYKDDTLNISGSGERVRFLISEHLISLGINPKIQPVELLSPQFIRELELNQSPKARASELEHAIRKHCKVHLDEDPVLYRTLSEKLEALIQKHKDDWESLYRSLFDLRTEAEAGRRDENAPRFGPFFDLIGQIAFGDSGVPLDYFQTVQELAEEVLRKLRQRIGIVSFWSNPSEVNNLKGDLSDLLLFSNIDEIVDKSDKIVAEITALAKVRHRDIMEGGDQQALSKPSRTSNTSWYAAVAGRPASILSGMAKCRCWCRRN